MRVPVPKKEQKKEKVISLCTYGDLFVYIYNEMENGRAFSKTVPILKWELNSILKEAGMDLDLVRVEDLRFYCMGTDFKFELVAY